MPHCKLTSINSEMRCHKMQNLSTMDKSIIKTKLTQMAANVHGAPSTLSFLATRLLGQKLPRMLPKYIQNISCSFMWSLRS